ncbi:putative exo-1,4-beta-xylosidase xlnD [Nitrospirillum viridazoti Y2]|nr:putative exo-1,4-beta-xylosidase xlnD [Nitrospirillum amazonense Y2]
MGRKRMRYRPLTRALLLGAAFFAASTQVRADQPTSPAVGEAWQKAQSLVARMTLDEKLGQLVNVAPAIPRLDIPAYNWWTESLHGAIGAVPTTNFPEPIGLAATFDAPLVHDVAGTVSVEVRALHTLGRATGHLGRIGTGLDTWSPNINIYRDPRWGRGQETYGEDPYLTARLAVAFVGGMQGPNPDLPDVVATPKHFAVHSGPESTRHAANVYVSPHDLEDTYLPAFRAAIVEARAGSIMCAYNRIDGQPACASDLLLKDHLRGAWHFTGYVVSDCDAVKDIADNHKYAPDQAAAVAAALKAGVDNECNVATLFGGGGGLAARYKEAYTRGLIGAADIDLALVRLFSARYRNGDLPGLDRPKQDVPVQAIGTAEHQQLARKVAGESMVLLKNDGVLPLKPGVKVAVIGPHGDSTRVLRGNYSSALSAPPVSVLDGLRQVMPGARVTHVPFNETVMDGDPVPTSALVTPDGKPGVRAQYFNANGPVKAPAPDAPFGSMPPLEVTSKPVLTRVEAQVGGSGHDQKSVAENYHVVWTGFLVPPESGTYRLGMTGFSGGEFEFDGRRVDLGTPLWGDLPKLETVTLEKGKRYPIRVATDVHTMGGVEFLWKRVSPTPTAATPAADGDLAAAVADADVIVAAVGLSADLEGEEMKRQIEGFAGGDKTSLDLPSEQRRLLQAAKATGKPVVVVLLNGSPLDLSWAKDNAAAIVEAWYPGQAGGLAVADVLSGKTNPAGRLPLTFYRSVADLPPFDDYAMTGRTYRYFTGQAVYPFGYGLSYTRFDYGPVTVEPTHGGAENGVRVTATVTNTGDRAGDEVAQLYLKPPAFEGAPRLALRGFQRLSLAPGESRTVSFELSPRDLSFVTRDGDRQVMVGTYQVSVGSGQPDSGVTVKQGQFATTAALSIER